MLDDLNMRPNQDGQRESNARPVVESTVVGDREVPIAVTSPFEAMHRWLDGEATEQEAMRDSDSARYVELWRRVGSEIGRRRDTEAPAGLQSRIMAAIPGGSADVAPMAATRAAAPALHIAPAASVTPDASRLVGAVARS